MQGSLPSFFRPFSSRTPAFLERQAFRKARNAKIEIPEIPASEKLAPFPALERVQPLRGSVRSGLLGYKIGQTGLWDEWGARHNITVVKVHDCYVTGMRTIPKDGYEAVQLSCGVKPMSEVKHVELGTWLKHGILPKQDQAEFRVSSENLLPIGLKMSVRHFVPGQWAFVSGFTKAKGYMGARKAWSLSGQRATHGTTKGVNQMGCVGQGKGIGKVWKFKKMDGHRGDDPRVVNVQVFRTESTRGLLFLKGCIPGEKGSLVKISDARGKTAMKNRHIRLPFPTFVPQQGVEYPVTVQQPPLDKDPFLFPDRQIKEKRVKA